MTRTGKIARLPRLIRDQLNRRLDDGESGQSLVTWLNSLAEVRQALAAHHASRPITEQNLSEWRQGGFQDWQCEQSARVMLRDVAELHQTLHAESGSVPVSDWLATPVALAFARCVSRLTDNPSQPLDEEATREVLALTRGLTRLRRSDHEQQRLDLLIQRFAPSPAPPTSSDPIRPPRTKKNK